MKILLATDLSEGTVGAADVAAAFARRSGQPIVLLHVFEPPPSLVAQVAASERFELTMRDRSHAALQAQARNLRALSVPVEARLEDGEVPERITEVAREIGASLVIVASHRRGGLDRLLLGGVAHETILRADRPVLVARSGAVSSAMADWGAGRRPLRVTLAIDRSAASGAAAQWLGGLGDAGPIEVRLVHVYSPVLEAARLGLKQREGEPDVSPTLEHELRAFLGPFLDARKVRLELRASEGRPGAVVASLADPAGTDLLVMGTAQRRGLRRLWLGSTAELALRRARVPMVCVPIVSGQVLDATAREEIGKQDLDDVC